MKFIKLVDTMPIFKIYNKSIFFVVVKFSNKLNRVSIKKSFLLWWLDVLSLCRHTTNIYNQNVIFFCYNMYWSILDLACFVYLELLRLIMITFQYNPILKECHFWSKFNHNLYSTIDSCLESRWWNEANISISSHPLCVW